MIAINLLPVRQIRRRLKAQKEVLAFFVLLLAVLVLVGIAATIRTSQVTSKKDHIASLTKKRDSYKSTLNEIEKFKKDKQSLETKLAVIAKLKKDSQFTVRVIDEIANVIPANRVWLTSMSESAGKMAVSGVAVDNASIAVYMQQLESSPYFANPELGSSSLSSKDGREVRNFSLSCEITNPTEKKTDADGKQDT